MKLGSFVVDEYEDNVMSFVEIFYKCLINNIFLIHQDYIWKTLLAHHEKGGKSEREQTVSGYIHSLPDNMTNSFSYDIFTYQTDIPLCAIHGALMVE